MRVILLISLVLNAVFFAAFLGWYNRPRPQARPVRAPASVAAASNGIRIIKTNVLVRPRLFAWQEVESADYATYIQNLRALGMPENTIRDIIIADVDQVFTQRRRQLVTEQDFEWWRSQPSGQYQSNSLAKAMALEEERNALLTRLLGANWKADRLDQQPDPVPLTGPVLSALPEETKKSVQAIATQSGERARQYVAQMEAAGQRPSELELAKLREQTREQLAQLLTPEQLEEFLLRNSHNASQLRRDLTGLEVSPEEFRRLFRSVDGLDRMAQLRYSGDDPEAQRQRTGLEQQRLAAIREVIGAERYDTFAMLRDPGYQQDLVTIQNAGLPEQSAAALFEISQATSEEVDRIRSDPRLTEAQKQQQIRETELERQRARALVLGDDGASQASVPGPPPLRPHVLTPGETLGQLSFRYGIGMGAIREANPGIDINRLPPGAVVNIPSGQGQVPSPPYPPGVQVR